MQLDIADDKKKDLSRSVSGLEKAIGKEKELMASDGAAKELLGFARNRMQKFYNPKLYKPPPKRELSEEDRATLAAGGTLPPTAAPGGIAGTGVTVLADVSLHSHREAPPPPPETFGAYAKKSGESTGVIAM